ncbi:MAG: bifunctional phosphoribosylaminoimidazolecarboxamide formyltransferase/IMP cyclohydrolase [Nitrospinae bacterium]|nr:bifunctional phosphoribosylaminoimidazolecarboxamide formyltransferase/IMP cyclohydrolase [Nitrospinota bacterium]
MNTVVKRALISVSDKTGLEAFVKGLATFGVEILSTGGTAKAISQAGVAVKEVSDHTGSPEILDGRVKTLHPKIHGGLLGRRDLESHVKQMAEHGITPIDMVVVNLYPFEKTVAKPGVSLEEAIENIDIGGPSMLRSASKNFESVTVVVDPADYDAVLAEMERNGGSLSRDTRLKLATKAFAHTAWYDGRINSYLENLAGAGGRFPDRKMILLEKRLPMRYGENPHQGAAFYASAGTITDGIPSAIQHHGKELSFNNIVDLAAAYELVCEFSDPAVAIIKHTNPCGVARAANIKDAYVTAREVDPVSAFGGVIAINRKVDKDAAEEIGKLFAEVVIAPGFEAAAMAVLKEKKNVRLMELPLLKPSTELDYKFVRGGALLQDPDAITYNEDTLKVVSKRQPTEAEMKALKFAWTVAKHVKSNAIVYAGENSVIGVGAGQMSRVDSSQIAVSKARGPVKGSVMASDAFFPFRDGIDAAGKAGVTAVIQPGGSVRDEEVIAAADEYGMAMVFTGVRHFKH